MCLIYVQSIYDYPNSVGLLAIPFISPPFCDCKYPPVNAVQFFVIVEREGDSEIVVERKTARWRDDRFSISLRH